MNSVEIIKCSCCGCVINHKTSRLRGEYVCCPCRKEMRRCRAAEKKDIYLIVRHAVRVGFLRPADSYFCMDCGGLATDYDHRDYNKPLEVDPVCTGCNNRRGPGIPLNPKRHSKFKTKRKPK